MRRVATLLLAAVLLTGCATDSSRTQPKEPAPPAPPAPVERQPATVAVTVAGRSYRIVVGRPVEAARVIVAPGPDGFYWALPQPTDELEHLGIRPPITAAVIRYTPYSQAESIDPAQAQVIYELPLKDIANTGATRGGLRLGALEVHGPWLFYLYTGIVPGGAQAAYVALGALDTRSPIASPRFLYRGGWSGGLHLKWAASEHHVVWQQGTTAGADLAVTTALYDLATGQQQALPLPPSAMTALALEEDVLHYKDTAGDHALPLPPSGSGKLVAGAKPLPSVAFGDVPRMLRHNFDGKVYLPAVVAAQPFYQVNYTVTREHYRVEFSGSDHPVPVNATRDEAASLGGGPPLARTLGVVEAYTGDALPDAAKQATAPLPPGLTFSIRRGGRVLEGHFVQPADGRMPSVWWQDGSWRYQLAAMSVPWTGTADEAVLRELNTVLQEVPAQGGPAAGATRGEVTVGFAGDHRSTDVWFQRDDQWVHLWGYHFNALRGAGELAVYER